MRHHGRLLYKIIMHTRHGLRGLVRQLGFLGFCLGVAATAVAAPPPGFTPLFNGKDLAGWRGWAIHSNGGKPPELEQLSEADQQKAFAAWTADAARHWTVQNGELVNDGSGAYLATDREYGDYELLLEYKSLPESDSGIYLKNTPQVQIEDAGKDPQRRPGGLTGSGGLFNNGDWPGRDPLVRADKPFGEWNSFRIIQLGERTTVYLNDTVVVDHARLKNFWTPTMPLPKRGRILLQTHGGAIRWRNIFIREIGSAEANALLTKQEGAGFEPAFNGRDFTGWQIDTRDTKAGNKAPGDVMEAKDGTIVWKQGKGGTPYWNTELGDFAARLQFKLPPGGNNGLAIRYPGTGNAAYDGMTELQVLDEAYNTVKKLPPAKHIDVRQYHGSAYGLVAAARGYLRPVGEWNFQEVTVKGSTIRVELNGTVILDTDLAKVDLAQAMGGKAHPGKDRKTGYFGLAGHTDPVAFKDLAIRKL